MKKILFILLTLAIPSLLLAAEPVREWKNKSGKTIIEASLDSMRKTDDPEQVYLLKDGKRYKVPLNSLSKTDQDYVTKVRQGGRGFDDGWRNGESRAMQIVPASRRFALLIGVNAYPKEEKLKTLPSAVKDMTDLADALEKFAGFPRENIVLMTDKSPENLLPTLANIQQQIAKIRVTLTQNDLLIVAFSGHGVTIDYTDDRDARPYFCVRDTDLPDIDTLLSRNWVFEQIDKCKADRKIFFCDACRTLYTKQEIIQIASRAGQNASIRSLEDPSESWGYNYVLMSSCARGQNSIDTGANGLFTSYLLEGLRTSAAALRDGDLTAFSWFEYAAKKTEIASERMIRENPALVIGAAKQKQQTPRIECRGEMSRFVIAKLDRAGLEIAVPQNVEDVKVQEYQVGSLRVRLQSSGSTLSDEKILAGKIQLPPIPVKINKLTGEALGIKDALTRMENGTHEAILEAERAKTAAQAQYEAIKMRRDAEWSKLSPEVQKNLEQRIKESPTSTPMSFSSLRPKDIGFSQFIKLVLWGQKTEQARLERLRVEKTLKTEIQKEINRIKAALADKNGELDLETRKFRQALVQFLLEKTPGWNKPNESEEMDYMFLSETIPALLKYPFGWDEESLFNLAGAIWKERRPCVKERIKREKEKQEQIAREEAAKAEARKHDLSIPGTEAGERRTVSINGVVFAFRWCPSGTFIMGSPTSEEDPSINETRHRVTLTKGFWMMETEVTQIQWQAVMGTNPSKFKGDDLPVESVSWSDCQDFCEECTRLGLPAQLPTEAQWEYACRAGSTKAFFWGNALNGDNANCNGKYPFGTTIKGRFLEKTMSVGSYQSNAWGLYDMHGNVGEWCRDWFGDYPSKSVTDPTGPKSGSTRVTRGGSWDLEAWNCRSASRHATSPRNWYHNLGFRVVSSITHPED